MGLNIENRNVERLAKQPASETGQSITGAIGQAPNGELHRLRLNDGYGVCKARVKEILRRSGPTPPGATSDHRDLYDAMGLFK